MSTRWRPSLKLQWSVKYTVRRIFFPFESLLAELTGKVLEYPYCVSASPNAQHPTRYNFCLCACSSAGQLRSLDDAEKWQQHWADTVGKSIIPPWGGGRRGGGSCRAMTAQVCSGSARLGGVKGNKIQACGKRTTSLTAEVSSEKFAKVKIQTQLQQLTPTNAQHRVLNWLSNSSKLFLGWELDRP